MPSGADLEYARMLAASGRTSGAGLDGALLEQLGDSNNSIPASSHAVKFGVSPAAQEAPNILLGGERNGSGFGPDVFGSTILNPGTTIGGNNNVVGGDTSTVGTTTPNAPSDGTGAIISVVGGYDNVAASISSKIISDHSKVEYGVNGHNAIYGGSNHTVKGTSGYAIIIGGRYNECHGGSSVTGGFTNVNKQGTSLVTGGLNVVGTGEGSAVTGSECVIEDDTDFANVVGYRNTIKSNADASRIMGAQGIARTPMVDVHAGGRIAANGDAQIVRAHYQRQTTSATPLNLQAVYPSSTSPSQYKMVQGQTAVIEVTVAARKVGGPTVGAWTIKAVADWATGAGNPTWVMAPVVTSLYTDGSAAVPNLVRNLVAGQGQIYVQCTGVAATNINWSAKFEATEIMG